MYPEHRNKGTGEQLISEILDHARSSGYAEMVLDTLRPMESAIALYKRFGFEECESHATTNDEVINLVEQVLYNSKF